MFGWQGHAALAKSLGRRPPIGQIFQERANYRPLLSGKGPHCPHLLGEGHTLAASFRRSHARIGHTFWERVILLPHLSEWNTFAVGHIFQKRVRHALAKTFRRGHALATSFRRGPHFGHIFQERVMHCPHLPGEGHKLATSFNRGQHWWHLLGEGHTFSNSFREGHVMATSFRRGPHIGHILQDGATHWPHFSG